MDCNNNEINSKASIFVSFNCKSITRSVDCVRLLCQTSDIIALQETWLLPHDIPFLGTIDPQFNFVGKSAVDTSPGILRGRPYGGVAILWRKSAYESVSSVQCESVRLVAIKITVGGKSFLVFSVYMPTESVDNLGEFVECLSEIHAIIESSGVDAVYILGDFNAQPNSLFGKELVSFSSEVQWRCADVSLLGGESDTYTYVSDAHGSTSWLDHCVVTDAAWDTIRDASVLYDVSWSDHFPLIVKCDLNLLTSKITPGLHKYNKVTWGDRDFRQIELYSNYCNDLLKNLDFPIEFTECSHGRCKIKEHKTILDSMYAEIVRILCEGAIMSCNKGTQHHKRYITGWNKHVKDAHGQARLDFQTWTLFGRPKSGTLYEKMVESRRLFKNKLKWCQNNKDQIKMDIIASHHDAKNFGSFWKATNSLNLRSSLPVSVEGVSDPNEIANLFSRAFKVASPLGPSSDGSEVVGGSDDMLMRFSAGEVATVIRNLKRGKSPGHDSLTIEHLRHAGKHLPRVLAMFFSLCLSHSYLPADLLKTIVVPIVKNKTGDASDKSNYRPISLATTIAKVLDGLIDRQLDKHLTFHDAQFGFKPHLSTETAILCLKQTVQYYSSRKTPVYACFLDLSKAFDLVSYDCLWRKLSNVSDLPSDLITMLKYWYNNQYNYVKWAGVLSDAYRLECGVRQGGLSSPKLFNLYVNELICELSNTNIGCSIDGHCVNNISYADDMVLLSPSIGALRRLLRICESYAVAHGLRYNATKSELLVFKAGNKTYDTVPPVTLGGAPLSRVTKFKYLGHWVTDSMSDDVDLERERRALAVRCNMLARRFARCTKEVKITLFRAYCQSMYTCALWVDYTKSSYGALRVQYNNAFRVMLGLPRFCSASGMFAEYGVSDFYSIMRARIASLMRRVRDSSNSLVAIVAGRVDSPMVWHWMTTHRASFNYVK